jgi:hypothetical protein
MFSISLGQAEHIQRFTISPSVTCGWDVTWEHDSHVTRHHTYQDWHRVERALAIFKQEMATLLERGWREI